MIDFSKQTVTVNCGCGRSHSATLQDVANSKVISCFCGTSIQLKDNNGSVKKGVNDMNRAAKDLENTLKNFSKKFRF